MSELFVDICDFEEDVVWFDVGDLLFGGIFIGIYVGFGRFFGEGMVGVDVDLYFFIMFDVMGYCDMSGFDLMVCYVSGGEGLDIVFVEGDFCVVGGLI